jgi:hypothetical protein
VVKTETKPTAANITIIIIIIIIIRIIIITKDEIKGLQKTATLCTVEVLV